ncbi:MAG: cyclic nucleotide-binding domain-containing protein [Planctomycetes bacterium]|nr:cyclic nucleotide-binding domain-containing protein [Planctomycetota bacterium]
MAPREAVVREYSTGEILCRQGAAADRLFVLRAGGIRCSVVPDKVLVEADDARLSRGHDIAFFNEPGSSIGVEGALAGHYQSSLIAAETSVVVEVPCDTRGVMSMITEKPEFGVALARMLARRLMAANRSLGSSQRTASRFLRDFQGMCVDFYNLVQRIGEDSQGEDDVLQALNAAKRHWAYGVGESGGAELARNTRVLMARVVDDKVMSSRQHKLASGDYLCRKGDPGGSVYLLVSGRLSVKIGSEQFGVVRPGETVGEMGVLLGEEEPKRMADIVADEPSICGVIPNDQFVAMIGSQPRLLINLCKVMTLRVKSFEQLAAESDDALRAVAARFEGGETSFEEDCTSLRENLEMLLNDNDLALHQEVEALARLEERWTERMGELKDKLSAAGAR